MSRPIQPLSEMDLELLSSYIDGELSPADTSALETRLRTEDALQTALTGLQETVTLLRSVPRLKAPRDFTLDPTVYGRKSAPLIPFRVNIWRLGSTVGLAASILLIMAGLLIGVGDISQDTSETDQSVAFDRQDEASQSSANKANETDMVGDANAGRDETIAAGEAADTAIMLDDTGADDDEASRAFVPPSASDGMGGAGDTLPPLTQDFGGGVGVDDNPMGENDDMSPTSTESAFDMASGAGNSGPAEGQAPTFMSTQTMMAPQPGAVVAMPTQMAVATSSVAQNTDAVEEGEMAEGMEDATNLNLPFDEASEPAVEVAGTSEMVNGNDEAPAPSQEKIGLEVADAPKSTFSVGLVMFFMGIIGVLFSLIAFMMGRKREAV